jgi:hydroxymethylpyrimidine pyrophosphatase-like HAD family hydrolase
MADEAYAVTGAAPELAEHATAIIGSNDDDVVARWLAHRWHTD